MPFPFTVNRIEYLGADRLVYGTLEAPHPPTKVISRLPSTIALPIETGRRYDFAVRERDLKFFDRETGRRMARGA